jgi:hypothetical protein
MSTGTLLEREEYIEQAYFFRVLRERLGENLATQEVLARIDQEILSTTRLPFAIQFLAAEVKHTGLLSSGFARLPHYFTPFQSFVVRQAEEEGQKFTMGTALLVLEREASYKAGGPTRPGLFVYQFEAISRNRLGYDEVHRHRPPAGRCVRLRRPRLRPVRAVRDREAAERHRFRPIGAAVVRGEGGEDRQGEPRT